MYDILGDKYLSKSTSSILVVCNKQGELVRESPELIPSNKLTDTAILILMGFFK